MSAEMIKRDLDQFEVSLKRLSVGVGRVSGIWQDPKFSELYAEVSRLAAESVDMMKKGERYCSELGRFDSIASESY